MGRIAILSLHTSPLAQPGTGDGGGMNVYVRELSSALAHAGVDCDVYTRAWRPDLAPVVKVEQGVRVHHVPAGPRASVAKEDLPELVPDFTAAVLRRMEADGPPTLIHANYWLSGVSGHALKHELGLPLVSTFHTLARVPGHGPSGGDVHRAQSEADIIGCSDTILASSVDERAQLQRLYGAVPSRVEIVPPGVDHELFSPGDRDRARADLGLGGGPVLLFVGRIQPLKGIDVAVNTLSYLPKASLVIVGGPSGRDGDAELRRLHEMVEAAGFDARVRFVAPQAHESLTTYYRAANVCLVPSRSESFGLVALEAAACGTPVVAAAVGGLTSLVDDGRTGFLVPGRDSADYAQVIAELLEHPDSATDMGVAAARRARQYSWSIAAARLRRLYGDLAARQPVECVARR